jgi:hypothetical protein
MRTYHLTLRLGDGEYPLTIRAWWVGIRTNPADHADRAFVFYNEAGVWVADVPADGVVRFEEAEGGEVDLERGRGGEGEK